VTMTDAAFKAEYADWKLIRGRKVVQVVFEVPIELSDAAYDVLGGMPNPAVSSWFGIARLNPEAANKEGGDENTAGKGSRLDKTAPQLPAKVAGAAKSYAQECGRMCNDVRFQQFIKQKVINGDLPGLVDVRRWNHDALGATADFVRDWCSVISRADILDGTGAAVWWNQLVAEYEAEKVMA
jgi:hypothetical protein